MHLIVWAGTLWRGSLHGMYFWKNKNRACPLREGLCALRARELFCYGTWAPAQRAAIHGGHYIRVCIATPSRRVKPGLSFERRFLCPAGTAAFLFLLFGPPPAGARRGRLWGCAPFSAPLASPPKHPALAFQFPTFSEGCAAIAPGASSLRSAISLRTAQCHQLLLL